MVQKNIQVICRIITSGTLILSRRIGSHVEFDFRALRNWARAGMVEWNEILRLFRFSGILGQPREVHPKFRNEIPENVCSIRPKPGISGIFGRMESAQELHFSRLENCESKRCFKRLVRASIVPVWSYFDHRRLWLERNYLHFLFDGNVP